MSWIKLILIIIIISPGLAYCQPIGDSLTTPVKKKSLRIVAVSAAATYTAGLAGLNHLWYKDSGRQRFRFFNDNAEWKQMDKAGHFYSSFHLSHGFSRGLKHFNVEAAKSDLTGALLGFAVLVPIEVFDGFSDAYGASVGDLGADAAGALFYYGQARLWNEVRLHPKFSFRYSPYAERRPELLGKGMERILKDYNGQTYWLSIDADKFFRFPKWLNISVGYGASGMVYARDEQHIGNGLPTPFRRYFLSLDFDVQAIRTRSKAVKTILFVVNMIRIPSPAIEFSQHEVRFHGLYF
jgi:hypothetical protein